MNSRIRKSARRLTLLLTPAAYSLLTAAPAWAAVGVGVGALWIGVTDGDGVAIGTYGLSLDNGSLTNPQAAPSAMVHHWLYSAFLTIIGLAMWLIDNVLSFQWLSIIATPIDFVGQKVAALVVSPAVLLFVGTLAAGFIAVNVLTGKLSRAAVQIGTAVILALLAVTLGSKPLSDLVGPDGGLAMGRDIGIELTTELSGKSSTGEQALSDFTTSLADNFVRTPTLVWNFGANLDADPYNCGGAWSAAVQTGDIDTVKDAVQGSCPGGERLHQFAMNDSSSKGATALMSILFALCVLAVFGYLCYQVVLLALSALFWAIVAIVALIAGMIPGSPQGLAIKSALDAVFAIIGMTCYIAILGLTGALTSAMFTLAGDDVIMAMPLVSLLLVALVLALRKVGKGLVAVRNRAAQRAASFGAGTDAVGNGLTSQNNSPGLLDRLDPLTAVPHATHTLSARTKSAATTAAKLGVATAAPEVAPFIGAADALMSKQAASQQRNQRAESTAAESRSPRPPRQSHGRPQSATSPPSIGSTDLPGESNAESTSRFAPPAAPPDTPSNPASSAEPSPGPRAPTAASTLSQLTPPPADNGAYTPTGLPAREHHSTGTDAAFLMARPATVEEAQKRFPALCGHLTTRGDYCINPADTCPHHPRRTHAAPAMHPALADLARGHGGSASTPDGLARPADSRDVRTELMMGNASADRQR